MLGFLPKHSFKLKEKKSPTVHILFDTNTTLEQLQEREQQQQPQPVDVDDGSGILHLQDNRIWYQSRIQLRGYSVPVDDY